MILANGKMERFNGSVKSECIRQKALTDVDHAKEIIGKYIEYYNNKRLHSAIGYVAPADMLAGRAELIQETRDHKLNAARERRRSRTAEMV